MYRYCSFLLFLSVLCVSNDAWGSVAADSVFIITDSDSLLVCEGTTIDLEATTADSYSWSPAADFDDPTAQNVVLTPSQSQWYYLDATLNGVDCRDSVYIELIDPTFSVSLSRTDTICPKERVVATFISNNPITSITWEPVDGVVDPENTDSTDIRPLETTEYIVTAEIGNCELSDTFTIHVIPFRLELVGNDTLYLCKPDTQSIRFNVSPPAVQIVWSPLDGFIDPFGNSADVFPEVSTTYNATAEHMGCVLSQDIFVRVDSLPPLDLIVIPEKDPYCAGEEVYLIGANVDTSLYPDLVFQWTPDDGQIQDSTNTGNVRVITNDTTTFIREVRNNACIDSSFITLNVIPPAIPLSVNDTTLCPGEMFQVFVLDMTVEDIEWMPPEGLSCTECFDPVVTVGEQQVMYMVSGEKEGCPVGASLNVFPKPDYFIPVSPNPISGCEGDMIQVQVDTFGGVTNISLSVTGGNTISCTDCVDPIITIAGPGQLIITGDHLDSMFCDAFAQVPILIGEPEQVPGGVFPGCVGDPITIDLTGYGFVNPVVSITGDATLECNDSDCLMPTVTLNSNSNANLIVDSDDSSPGFCGKITTFLITPSPMDQASFILSDSMPGQGEIITVTLVTQPPPAPGTTFSWTANGVPLDGDGISVEVALNEAGVNVVEVTWINSSGCPQTYSEEIFAREPEINIPNAFTPNGDDANDFFKVDIVGNIRLTEFVIFNRWGQVVYNNTDPQGWDGMHNGEPAPPEVYVYSAKFEFPSGKTERMKGDVTLIR